MKWLLIASIPLYLIGSSRRPLFALALLLHRYQRAPRA